MSGSDAIAAHLDAELVKDDASGAVTVSVGRSRATRSARA
ncbi:hypothetical protein SAMN04490357_0153 [Streptomyces misionensis]|uniref:Uncharacterized protein n=1 Tax=Streptomyces misionensis TaxID=67331 RepID=A0A1H4IBD4_9ACTN|nr:hypothetical protein SAMN04490357_0153 [Streptomyces misionensis]